MPVPLTAPAWSLALASHASAAGTTDSTDIEKLLPLVQADDPLASDDTPPLTTVVFHDTDELADCEAVPPLIVSVMLHVDVLVPNASWVTLPAELIVENEPE